MKIISLLPAIVLIIGCLPVHLPQSMGEPPENAASFPKLKERNRLLGALSPERTCYDVQHYDINIDIDVDKKYVKGYVDSKIQAQIYQRLLIDSKRFDGNEVILKQKLCVNSPHGMIIIKHSEQDIYADSLNQV